MMMQVTILAIDDDPAVLLSIQTYLEDLSYSVLTATNGNDGLASFYASSPDLVLVDLNMPGISGQEVIRTIHQFTDDTPIIVISGVGILNEAIECIRIGAWDFLSKPLMDMRILHHTIEKALERRQLIRENKRYQHNLEAQIIAHTEKLMKVNEALKVSEEKYRSYIEQSPDGIVAMNTNGKLLAVNDAFVALTGYSRNELLEIDPSITPTHARQHWGHLHSHMTKLLKEGAPSGELLFVRKGEELIWLGFTAARMPGGDIIGFYRNITASKIAAKEVSRRQEIQQMQKDLAAWLSVCPNLEVAAADVLGQLTWLDDVDCGSLFMVSEECHLSLIAQTNVSEAFWEQVSPHTTAYLESHLNQYMEPVYFDRSGIRIYMGDTAVQEGLQCAGIIPLRYGGETEAIICIASKAEKTFSETTREAVESVAALTSVAIARLMVEKELRDAMQQAKDANRLKSRFVSNVSHELRTPLNGIIGFSEFIMASSTVEEARENARTIIRESEVLLRLINSLLDHAKMEEGKLELNPEILDIHALLDDMARNSFLQAHRKGLDFDLKLGTGLPKYIVADGLRIRQVLNNLLSNALKFTEKGSIHLSATVIEQLANDTTIRFAVTDTGIGIPPERQKAIFDSFVQADSGTARKYGGSGLGTTISLQLVKLMNGQMGLESEAGKGSEFWFSITFPTPAVADAEAKIKSSLVQMLGPIDVASGQILLAEDYLINQKVIGSHLENEGFHFTVVENGHEAVDICEEKAFSLILMDVNMPLMDGIEATGLIRSQSSRNRNTPILALTASAEPETRDACLKAGMNDVITKPVKRETFIGAVHKWFMPVSIDENGNLVIRHSATPGAAITDTGVSGIHQLQTEENGAVSEPAETESDGGKTPLDVTTLLEQFAGNRVLAQTMIDHFKQAVPGQIRQMEKALNNNDMEMIRKEAHKIKGGAGSIAAFVLMDVARRLEDAAREGIETDASVLLGELSDHYTHFRDFQLK